MGNSDACYFWCCSILADELEDPIHYLVEFDDPRSYRHVFVNSFLGSSRALKLGHLDVGNADDFGAFGNELRNILGCRMGFDESLLDLVGY